MIASRSRSRFERAISGWSPAARYGVALVIVLATTGLIALINSDWLIFDRIGIENPGTIYIAAITLVALLMGLGPALVAAAASMLAVFLAFSRYESFERAVVLAATMLVIIALVEWQRRAQEEAERAQAKFAAILESMSDAVMTVDAAGHATDVNRAAIAMLGAADRPDALAKIARRADGGAPTAGEYALLERALGGEEAARQDIPIPDAPGGPRIVGAVASPMRDARGRVIGAVSVSRDLTDRVRGEREREALLRLVEERRQFTQAIFDTVPASLAVVDTDAMTFRAANPAFVASTPEPYRSHGVNDCSVAAVLPHTSENGFIGQLQAVGRTGEPIETVATRYAHPTRGTTFWNEMITPLTTSDPTRHHVLYIAADVTKEVEAQEQVVALAREAAERANQLDAVITNMPDGVAIYAPDGRLLQMNPAGRRIAGEDPEPGEAVSAAAERFQFRYPDGSPLPLDDLPLPRSLRGATVSGYEFVSRTRRGDAYLLASSAPIRDAEGTITGAVVMFTDITDRKQAERERERLLREVEDRRQFAQTVIDSAPAGIAVCTADADFTVLLANDRFRAIVGDAWAEPRLDGVPFHAFTPDAEEAGILPIFRRVAETGEPVSLSEFEYAGSGGDPLYLDWSLVPLRAGSEVTSLILLINDVTDRVLSRYRIEELADAAAQRAAELEAIIANMPDGVAIYGPDGQLMQMNAAGRNISGEDLSRDDALPEVVEHFDLRYPDGRLIPLDDLPLPRALRGETVSGYEFISRTRHGDRHILMGSAPVMNAAGAVTSAVVIFSDITERKRAEELTTRLGRILDASSNEIYVYDAASLHYLQVNEGARRNLGYTLDELARMTPLDIRPELTAEAFEALIAPLRAGEQDEIIFEAIQRRKDGSHYPVEAHLQLSRGENPPVFVSIIQDITERRAAEQQREQLLREVDERRRFVQTVIESAPVGIAAFGTDSDLTVRMANDQYLRLLDGPLHEGAIAERGLRDFLPGADTAGITNLVGQAMERGETVAVQEFAYDGFARGTGYFDVNIVPLRESGAEITGILTVVADVTERVAARRRIEELAWDAARRASELETVIASIADGVMVTDAEGRIILENAASRRLLIGREQSRASSDLSRRDTEHAPRNPDGTPMLPTDLPLHRAMRGETVTEQVLIIRQLDTGEDRFLICSSAPVRAGSDALTGAVLVFRDITEMKQLDQMKDEFISIAAHELRTPLTSIKGYAELLDRRMSAQAGRESDRRSLGVIRKQTERLAGLVNEMLDVSRIEAGRLELNIEPFDLAALVGEVVNNMRLSSEAHHLTLAAEPGIEVQGDTARIEQVLINLIANALAYSPEGGDVDIRLWSEEGAALVAVRDQGIGVAPDELPHLFDRFYRAPGAGMMRSGGMGLGLYICREIVARHGGTIRAESIEGIGSTFTFSLPLIEKD